MPLDQHDEDEYGEHDPDECELCLEADCTIRCECRCGNCCERMIIEASLRDAEREPRIAERGRPIYDDMWGPKEQIGWFLNDPEHGHCVFFDPQTRLCTIHATRPLICRLFDCDAERAGERAALLRDGQPDIPT